MNTECNTVSLSRHCCFDKCSGKVKYWHFQTCYRQEEMYWKYKVVICIPLLLLINLACDVDASHYHKRFEGVPESEMTEEQRLLYRLMRRYDKASRPVYEAAKPVMIHLGITLTQVLDMDEKNQILTTNVWLDQEWKDERLIWNNMTGFATIKMLRIPCDLLWLPDIVLYNSVENHNKGFMKALTMVESNGNVFWPPIVRMRSSCKMDITYFPFDDQVCKLKLGSWAYDGFQVDVTNRSANVDLSMFVDNGEWTLVDTRQKRNVVYYACCAEPFPDVTFYIHLRRRVLYYFFNVIIPCMLLSILTLTGFCLPPDSGEKITLGLTVLLAFSVFMLLIAENMPPTSEYVPLIGIYLTVIMAMSALSVVFSVFVLNFHHRGAFTKGPPQWLKSMATCVARLLCTRTNFSIDGGTQTNGLTNRQSIHQRCNNQHLPECDALLTHEIPNINNVDSHGFRNVLNSANPTLHGSFENISMDEEIMKYFNTVVMGHEKALAEKRSIHDWQEVARVLDKVFFWSFLFITITSSLVLLIISPMTKEINIEDYIS